MAKPSISENFNNVFITWIKSEVLTNIANYITTEKKVPVTADELVKLLNIPASPSTPSNPMSFNAVMGLPTTATMVTNSLPAQKPATNKGRKKAQQDPAAAKCRYVFTKGAPDKVGTACGANCVAYGYCIACIGKNESLATMEKEGVKQDTIRRIKELKDKKTDLRAFLSDPSILSDNKSSEIKNPTTILNQPLVFHKIPNYEGIYIITELVPNACFFAKNENDPKVCRGKLKKDGEKHEGPFPLTNEEAKLIESKGYAYIAPKDGGSAPQTPAPVTNQPPQAFVQTSVQPPQAFAQTSVPFQNPISQPQSFVQAPVTNQPPQAFVQTSVQPPQAFAQTSVPFQNPQTSVPFQNPISQPSQTFAQTSVPVQFPQSFVSPQQSSNMNPPNVMFPQNVPSSNQLATAMTQTVMHAMPEIIKSATESLHTNGNNSMGSTNFTL